MIRIIQKNKMKIVETLIKGWVIMAFLSGTGIFLEDCSLRFSWSGSPHLPSFLVRLELKLTK